jgi:putative DNA primase/helicase
VTGPLILSEFGDVASYGHAASGNGDLAERWKLQPLSHATPRQTRWLVPGLVPLRFPTLVAGIGGLGKSTWLLALAAAGSVAGEPLETIYVSFEDTADEVLRPRLEAAGGNPDRVHEVVLADADSLESFSLPRDVDDLQKLVRSRRARLVVIDPIVAAVETKLDAYKDQHVRQVLAQLWRISREEDCAIALVGHLNRVPSTDAYLRISNSTAFWNAARSVVLITEDGESDDGRLIAQRKANLAPLAPVERHRLEEILLERILDPETGKPIVTSRMTFVEIADDVAAAEVLGPQKKTKTESAESLLAAVLTDGEWHESDAVKKLMGAAGYADRTVKRATKDLGVEHERRGFPASTWWRLSVGPNHASQVGPTGDTAKPCGFSDDSLPVGPPSAEQRATVPTFDRDPVQDELDRLRRVCDGWAKHDLLVEQGVITDLEAFELARMWELEEIAHAAAEHGDREAQA